MSTKTDPLPSPQLHTYPTPPGITAFSTTRSQGLSQGPYATFNINPFCGDTESHRQQNTHALCQKLGITPTHLIQPHQTHGTDILWVDDTYLQLPPDRQYTLSDHCDAVVCTIPDTCIGISTADCIPILLYDPHQGITAAIHAGWRGTHQHIVRHTIQQMQQRLGIDPHQLKAIIGPGISLDAFEVGDEVYEAFRLQGFPMHTIARRYPTRDGVGEKWHLDLPEANRQQLLDATIPPEAIHLSGICTYQQHHRFFSARRLGIHSGRIYTGIVVKGFKGLRV